MVRVVAGDRTIQARGGLRRAEPLPVPDALADAVGARLATRSPSMARVAIRSAGDQASGQPSGVIAALSTPSGMPRISWMRAFRRRCSVVRQLPSPRALAASRRFCTLG